MQTENIIAIKKLGKMPTYDIEVDSDNHLFFGNGIATSNSHSYGYSYNGYLSAYAKAHFKRAFFTSYLYYAKDKSGSSRFDEIRSFINNALAMGCKINPPTITRLYPKFKRINNEIYYGLTDIRDVGDSSFIELNTSIQQAENILLRSVTNFNWLQFLIFVSQNVKSSAIVALIESGALDCYKIDRNQMVYEFVKYSDITKREQAIIQQNFNIAEEKGNICQILEQVLNIPKFCNTSRYTKIVSIINELKNPPYSLKDTTDWIAMVEKSRLGIAMTCSVIDSCKDATNANTTCMEINDGAIRHTGVLVAAQIEDVKINTIKNGPSQGQEMARVFFSDITGSSSAVIFAESWAKIKSEGICYQDNVVLIGGEKSKRDGGLIVQKMWQLT